MLFDLPGLFAPSADHMAQMISTLAPGIVIWDQYVDLVEWSLNSLAEFFSSGGLAIIAFTIIIKTILLPLTVKSIRSSKAMQDLQPKIKELQKKYGKDRQRLSQETMALYSTYGVNPMAGCLPMLLQIPIFFGLYDAIQGVSRSGAGFWHGGFLWLDSLNAADPYKILPILAGVFQFVQTRMMRPAGQGKITDPQQAMMNTMMNFMPLMVIFFGWSFASGPVIYWATQSVFSAVQQYFITGWGALREWLPFLPEVVRYTPPDPDEVDESALVAKPDGERQLRGGFWGAISKQIEKVEEQRTAQTAPANGAASTRGNGAAKPTKETRVAVQTSGKAGRNGKATADAADADGAETKPAVPSPRVSVRKSSAGSNGRGNR